MVTIPLPKGRRHIHSVLATALRTRTEALPTDVALVAARTALAWIFIYHGSAKLFGSFNGPGIHGTALYFSNTPISIRAASSRSSVASSNSEAASRWPSGLPHVWQGLPYSETW
jgi:hypothetical protein